jgi:hypothetical protein
MKLRIAATFFMAIFGLGVVPANAGPCTDRIAQFERAPLDPLYALARRIRASKSKGELVEIEDEIDTILKTELAKTANGDDTATDPGILSLAAHRLEYLIHYRRTTLAEIPH